MLTLTSIHISIIYLIKANFGGNSSCRNEKSDLPGKLTYSTIITCYYNIFRFDLNLYEMVNRVAGYNTPIDKTYLVILENKLDKYFLVKNGRI